MQKVLVSAGAVGAAALELNNNQATEVVEAAPHGVQQRRRSQSKKEEPAALIKRGHTAAKAHHGNSVARVQNAGQVFWIVFGILAVIGLALGLGLGLGLDTGDNCQDFSKASDTPCACNNAPTPGQIPIQVKCTLATKADYDAFEAAKCTSIDQALVLSDLVKATNNDIVKKAEFKYLISAPEVFVDPGAALWTTQEINLKKLVKITANQLDVFGNSATNSNAFKTLKANCLKEVPAIQVEDLQNLETFQLNSLEKVTTNEFNIIKVGTKHTQTFSFNKLQSVGSELVIETDSSDKKQTFEFEYKGFQTGQNFRLEFGTTPAPANKCVDNVLEVKFAKPDEVFFGNGIGSFTNVNAKVGKVKFDNVEVAADEASFVALQASPNAIKVGPGGAVAGLVGTPWSQCTV